MSVHLSDRSFRRQARRHGWSSPFCSPERTVGVRSGTKSPAVDFHNRGMDALETWSRRCAVTLSLVAVATFVASSEAQTTWGGTVEVSPSTISIPPGETVAYSVRLTAQPPADAGTVDWFVMVSINGRRYQSGEYLDIKIIPSFYRNFNRLRLGPVEGIPRNAARRGLRRRSG